MLWTLMHFDFEFNNSEVVEKFPLLRRPITSHLIQTLPEIKSGKVYRGVLWIIGEYSEDLPDILNAFGEIRKVIGELPILASEQRLLDEASRDDEGDNKDNEKIEVAAGGGRPRVLADGTYATETAFTSLNNVRLEAVKAAAKPPIRCKCINLCSSAI
jgi:coatomer subunit beta